MQRVFVLVVVLWMLVGGFAAFQRGDFADGNCSTAADTALAVVTGPLNYAVPEILKGTCSQPAQLTIRMDRSPSLSRPESRVVATASQNHGSHACSLPAVDGT